ncbi:hypothetical protein AO411_2028045 [Salmonella enterica subsp. enterica serovar Sarajane]|nr:hypothetical protein AO411_2028045 [Salmonella enterica subsp. enterica serovar Sarajane]
MNAIRSRLKHLNGERLSFTAKISKFGMKSSFKGMPVKTILLVDIKIKGTDKILTDHVWFTAGKSWDDIHIGDQIEFDARITQYEKGYKGYRTDIYDRPVQTDYRLERPTKILKIG